MGEIALTSGNATLTTNLDEAFHLTLKPGSTLSTEDAASIILAVEGLSGTRLRPLLMEITDVGMTPGARSVLSETRFVSAVALVGDTVVDRVVAASLQRQRNCPQGYFASVDEAREWLRSIPSPLTAQESSV